MMPPHIKRFIRVEINGEQFYCDYIHDEIAREWLKALIMNIQLPLKPTDRPIMIMGA